MAKSDDATASGGSVWRNPGWLTAFAALISALGGVVAIAVNSNENHKPPSTDPAEIRDANDGDASSTELPRQRSLLNALAYVEGRQENLSAGTAIGDVEQVDADGLKATIPKEWEGGLSAYLEGEPAKATGTALLSTPDEPAYYENPATPGVFFGVSSKLFSGFDTRRRLNSFYARYSELCRHGGTGTIENDHELGLYRVWDDCAGDSNATMVQYTAKDDRGYVIDSLFRFNDIATSKTVQAIASSLAVSPSELP